MAASKIEAMADEIVELAWSDSLVDLRGDNNNIYDRLVKAVEYDHAHNGGKILDSDKLFIFVCGENTDIDAIAVDWPKTDALMKELW